MAIVLQALSGESHNNAGQGFAKVQIEDVAVLESLGEENLWSGQTRTRVAIRWESSGCPNFDNGPAYYDQDHLRHKLTVLT